MTSNQVFRADEIIHQLIALAIILRDEEVPPEDEQLSMSISIALQLVKIKDRVKGNRSNDCFMTWADFRLYFLSAIEQAKEIVDSYSHIE